MDILFLLVPISILLVFMIGLVFWWALNNRQFDALDEASERILRDIDTPEKKQEGKPTDSANKLS
jgi:cbb3-type cytochrome oxidase maturation protein